MSAPALSAVPPSVRHGQPVSVPDLVLVWWRSVYGRITSLVGFDEDGPGDEDDVGASAPQLGAALNAPTLAANAAESATPMDTAVTGAARPARHQAVPARSRLRRAADPGRTRRAPGRPVGVPQHQIRRVRIERDEPAIRRDRRYEALGVALSAVRRHRHPAAHPTAAGRRRPPLRRRRRQRHGQTSQPAHHPTRPHAAVPTRHWATVPSPATGHNPTDNQ